MQNSNMIISIFMFYYRKKGIPSENPFLFRKELHVICMLCEFRNYCEGLCSRKITTARFREYETLEEWRNHSVVSLIIAAVAICLLTLFAKNKFSRMIFEFWVHTDPRNVSPFPNPEADKQTGRQTCLWTDLDIDMCLFKIVFEQEHRLTI